MKITHSGGGLLEQRQGIVKFFVSSVFGSLDGIYFRCHTILVGMLKNSAGYGGQPRAEGALAPEFHHLGAPHQDEPGERRKMGSE